MTKHNKTTSAFINPFSYKFGLAMVLLGFVIGIFGVILFFFGTDWGLIALIPAAFLIWRGTLKMVIFVKDKDKNVFDLLNPYYICGILLIAIGIFLRGAIPIMIFCIAGFYVISLKYNKKISANKRILLAVFITIGSIGLYALVVYLLLTQNISDNQSKDISTATQSEQQIVSTTEQEAVAPPIQASETEYVNPKYNFKIKYPASWSEMTPDFAYTLFKLTSDDGNARITIKEYKNNLAPSQEELATSLKENKEAYIQSLEESGLSSVEMTPITIDNKPAYLMTYLEKTKAYNQITKQYDVLEAKVMGVNLIINSGVMIGVNYVTYPAENFDLHADEGRKIIDSFEFSK